MNDDIWQRDEIESPCINICVLHPVTGFCVGCHRSGDEIATWSTMSPEARRTIMAALPERAAVRLGRRRGGRAARRGESD